MIRRNTIDGATPYVKNGGSKGKYMRTTANNRITIACLWVAALVVGSVELRQVAAQQATPQQDAAALTPPPAYTAPPKGAPPAEDTPAQREAIAKWKARAELAVAADRKEYNSEVTSTTVRRTHIPPATSRYRATAFFSPARIQARNTAAPATRKLTASGVRLFTPTPSALRFIAPA